MWERGLDWDCELSNDLLSAWLQWCSELPDIRHLKIPRYYLATIKGQNSPVEKEVCLLMQVNLLIVLLLFYALWIMTVIVQFHS